MGRGRGRGRWVRVAVAVACSATGIGVDTAGREALLRHVLRPPIAQERLGRRPDGLVRANNGEPTQVPACSPSRGPPYWKSIVLRRKAGAGDDE